MIDAYGADSTLADVSLESFSHRTGVMNLDLHTANGTTKVETDEMVLLEEGVLVLFLQQLAASDRDLQQLSGSDRNLTAVLTLSVIILQNYSYLYL